MVMNSTNLVGFTKIRALVGKCGEKISTSVGFTKIRAFVLKCGQKISTSVGFTKSRAFHQNLAKIFLVLYHCPEF